MRWNIVGTSGLQFTRSPSIIEIFDRVKLLLEDDRSARYA